MSFMDTGQQDGQNMSSMDTGQEDGHCVSFVFCLISANY